MEWRRGEIDSPFEGWWTNDHRDFLEGCLEWSPSTDVRAMWQVRAKVKTWPFSRRRHFMQVLVSVISARVPLGGKIHESEVLLHVEPVDFCRAAVLVCPKGSQ
jgi:hypothetical protein